MKNCDGRKDLLTPYSDLSNTEKQDIQTLIMEDPDPDSEDVIFAKVRLRSRMSKTVSKPKEGDQFLSIVDAVLDGCNPFLELSEDDALVKIKELVWRWFKPTGGSHPEQPQKEIGHQKIIKKLDQR